MDTAEDKMHRAIVRLMIAALFVLAVFVMWWLDVAAPGASHYRSATPVHVLPAAATAPVAAPVTCVTEAEVRQTVTAQVADAKASALPPASYIKALNSLPPPSNIPVPARLVLFESPRRAAEGVLIVGFGDDGCRVYTLVISARVHAAIMDTMGKEI